MIAVDSLDAPELAVLREPAGSVVAAFVAAPPCVRARDPLGVVVGSA